MCDYDDLSVTDVEESLIGNEKHRLDVPSTQLQRISRRKYSTLVNSSTLRGLIDTTLLIIIIGLVLRQSRGKGTVKSSEKDIGGDFSGVSPHCTYFPWNALSYLMGHLVSTEIKTFRLNQTFAPYNTSEFFRPEVLMAWNELMPRMCSPTLSLVLIALQVGLDFRYAQHGKQVKLSID
jgi:hypothetical protein